jgi:hypothetical protein
VQNPDPIAHKRNKYESPRSDGTGFGFDGVWGPMNTDRGVVTGPDSGSMEFYGADEYESRRNDGTGSAADRT